jgi:hypothetical protein
MRVEQSAHHHKAALDSVQVLGLLKLHFGMPSLLSFRFVPDADIVSRYGQLSIAEEQ